MDGLELLDPLLRLISLALEHDDRPRETLDHFSLPLLELILTPAQLLEIALLPLELILRPLEREELLLGSLNLIVQLLRGAVIVLVEFEVLFTVTR